VKICLINNQNLRKTHWHFVLSGFFTRIYPIREVAARSICIFNITTTISSQNEMRVTINIYTLGDEIIIIIILINELQSSATSCSMHNTFKVLGCKINIYLSNDTLITDFIRVRESTIVS